MALFHTRYGWLRNETAQSLAIDAECESPLGFLPVAITDFVLPQAALALPQPHPAVALMARETAVREGPVPRTIAGETVADDRWALRGEEFLFRTIEGIGLHYRRGDGITLDRPPGIDQRTIALWLNGTLYAAIAALNGLFPFHASAVEHRGRVHAFTGTAGAGKSTLVAALGRAGFAQFCDDTLILDISGDGPPVCLPGHKRLKLWPEGVALAGVEPGELVAHDYHKHFVEPAAGTIAQPLPLAELVFLERGDAPQVVPLAGAERIDRLQDDHYTAELWRQANAKPRPEYFATLVALARRIAMQRFVRPFDPARFAESTGLMAAHIRRATA